MTKGTKCTFGGKKTLYHTRQLKKQLWHRKALEILHKKHKFWPAYHTASAYTLTTGLTPAAIRRRTRRGRRTMRCSKTCTAQTDRTQTIEEGCLPHSPCTGLPWLAPHFGFERRCKDVL